MRINRTTLGVMTAALLFASPAHAQADQSTPTTQYERQIAAAKAQMMGDSAAALKAAIAAEAAAKRDSDNPVMARLTAKWLQGEALMRLNRASEAELLISEALDEVAISRGRGVRASCRGRGFGC